MQDYCQPGSRVGSAGITNSGSPLLGQKYSALLAQNHEEPFKYKSAAHFPPTKACRGFGKAYILFAAWADFQTLEEPDGLVYIEQCFDSLEYDGGERYAVTCAS